MLEELDSYLTEQLGPQWWLNTPLNQIRAERKILMTKRNPTALSLALRVYPEPADSKRDPVSPKPWKCLKRC